MENLPEWVVLATGLFILLLAILWVLLPFAVFGSKKRLDELIYQMELTNDKLMIMTSEIKLLSRELLAYQQGSTKENENNSIQPSTSSIEAEKRSASAPMDKDYTSMSDDELYEEFIKRYSHYSKKDKEKYFPSFKEKAKAGLLND